MAQAFYGTVGIGGATALATILSGWLFARLGPAGFGNGFAKLLSVSHHLEPAYGAFTRSQALDERVGLIVTNRLRDFGAEASRELFARKV